MIMFFLFTSMWKYILSSWGSIRVTQHSLGYNDSYFFSIIIFSFKENRTYSSTDRQCIWKYIMKKRRENSRMSELVIGSQKSNLKNHWTRTCYILKYNIVGDDKKCKLIDLQCSKYGKHQCTITNVV